MLEYDDLSDFTRAYVEAIFFTETGPDAREEGLQQDYTFSDFAPKTIDKIVADCAAFELANKALLDQASDADQNGHDFWLTRNHHGAGFWDRGYRKPIGDTLTKKAQTFRELSLVLGDNGKLYLEG